MRYQEFLEPHPTTENQLLHPAMKKLRQNVDISSIYLQVSSVQGTVSDYKEI